MAGGYNMAGAVSRKAMRRKQDELWMAWEQVRELKKRNRLLWKTLITSVVLNMITIICWSMVRRLMR